MCCYRSRFGKNSVKMSTFSFPNVLEYVLGAQKNYLIVIVLLSTHNIYFGSEIHSEK